MGNKNEIHKKVNSLDSLNKFILNDVDNLKKMDTDRQTQISNLERHPKKGKKRRKFLSNCPCLNLSKDDSISYQTCEVSNFFFFLKFFLFAFSF